MLTLQPPHESIRKIYWHMEVTLPSGTNWCRPCLSHAPVVPTPAKGHANPQPPATFPDKTQTVGRVPSQQGVRLKYVSPCDHQGQNSPSIRCPSRGEHGNSMERCFNKMSNVLYAVRIRVRVGFRVTSIPARHSWVFWFWVHRKDMIWGSYMKGAWVHKKFNVSDVSAFNMYNLCYRTNRGIIFTRPMLAVFRLVLRHYIRSFHKKVKQFIRPRPSYLWIGGQRERKGIIGMKGHVLQLIELRGYVVWLTSTPREREVSHPPRDMLDQHWCCLAKIVCKRWRSENEATCIVA